MMRLKDFAAPDGKKPNVTAEWGCNASTKLLIVSQLLRLSLWLVPC